MNCYKPLTATKYDKETLHAKINYKGRDEQENKFLFPTLYGTTTRNEAGQWKQFERVINRKVSGVFFKFHL